MAPLPNKSPSATVPLNSLSPNTSQLPPLPLISRSVVPSASTSPAS